MIRGSAHANLRPVRFAHRDSAGAPWMLGAGVVVCLHTEYSRIASVLWMQWRLYRVLHAGWEGQTQWFTEVKASKQVSCENAASVLSLLEWAASLWIPFAGFCFVAGNPGILYLRCWREKSLGTLWFVFLTCMQRGGKIPMFSFWEKINLLLNAM